MSKLDKITIPAKTDMDPISPELITRLFVARQFCTTTKRLAFRAI